MTSTVNARSGVGACGRTRALPCPANSASIAARDSSIPRSSRQAASRALNISATTAAPASMAALEDPVASTRPNCAAAQNAESSWGTSGSVSPSPSSSEHASRSIASVALPWACVAFRAEGVAKSMRRRTTGLMEASSSAECQEEKIDTRSTPQCPSAPRIPDWIAQSRPTESGSLSESCAHP